MINAFSAHQEAAFRCIELVRESGPIYTPERVKQKLEHGGSFDDSDVGASCAREDIIRLIEEEFKLAPSTPPAA